MKAELMEKEVLAMYDVRGIQNYIFRSTKIQEIVGASILVENIIVDGLKKIAEDLEQEQFRLDWKHDNGTEFLENPSIQMQVLFIGGGNAYVLFRTGSLCSEINRKLAKHVLDSTYSLNLAVAVVGKTESFSEDYEAIHKEMRRIKATMPETRPVGVMPVIASDGKMGYPLSKFKEYKVMEYSDGSAEYLCTESWLKRNAFPKKEEAEKILDNMVTEKGRDSTLALVHIDGNNVGKRLLGIIREKEYYPETIKTMRTISQNIDKGLKEAFDKCETYVESKADKVKKEREGKLIREIIRAGDDITFICNAKVALGSVEAFIKETSTHLLYEEESLNSQENLKKYGLSACAGIAYFNSHFPFRDAYEIAESCCESAKRRAKSQECRENGKMEGNMGNFVDFQICMNVNAGNLSEYRKAQYETADKKGSMISRPYYISCPELGEIGDLNIRNENYDLSILKANLEIFNDTDKFPRSQAKRLRNCFSYGSEEVEKYMAFLKSRQREFPETNRESWYDALEIMDFAVMEGGKLVCF